jgi:hypothetical protein
MKLTATHHAAILFAPCNSKVGRGNPFHIGAKTPLLLVVFSFLRRSFVTGLIRAKFIMTGLLGKPSRLAVPVCGISTPFDPAAILWKVWIGDFSIKIQEKVA